MPENWDIKQVEKDYTELDTDSDITQSWIAGRIKQFLIAEDDHVVILEHSFANPNDPWIESKKVPIVSFKDDVLIDIYGKNAEDFNYIRARISHADCGMCSFGIMSSLPKSYLPLPKTIDENTIDLLAKRCESMIVSAFDGTGYIICSFEQ
jgi:hypothetical protein